MLRFDEDLTNKCNSVLDQLVVIEEMYRQFLSKSLGANSRKINFDLLKSTIEKLSDEETELFIQQQLNQYADNRGIQEVVAEYDRFLKFKKSVERSFSKYSFENVKSSCMLPAFDMQDYPTLDIYSSHTAPADLRNQAMPLKAVLEAVIEEVKAIHLQASFSADDRSGILFRAKSGSVNSSRHAAVVQESRPRFIVSSNSESVAADRRAKQLEFDLMLKQAEERKSDAKSFFNSSADRLSSEKISTILEIKFEDEFVKRYIQYAEIGPSHTNYVSPNDLYENLLKQYVVMHKLIVACDEYRNHLVDVDPVKFAKTMKMKSDSKVNASKVTFENKVMMYRRINEALTFNSTASGALEKVKAIVSKPETKQVLAANRDSFGTRLFKRLLLIVSFGQSARKPGLWKSHGAVHAEKLESIVSPAKGHSRS